LLGIFPLLYRWFNLGLSEPLSSTLVVFERAGDVGTDAMRLRQFFELQIAHINFRQNLKNPEQINH
jgi:hypothetical protein